MKPVVITVGGMELTTWTEMTLTRSKKEMTGQLSVNIFAGAMPSKPIVRMAAAGAPIQVYIGGHIAFTGTVDKRQGTGSRRGKWGTQGVQWGQSKADVSTDLGPNSYNMRLNARGMTKSLIDSSHQHPTTNMLKPTTKEVVEKLVQPFKIKVKWLGEVIKLDKVRFRDGARVIDELNRVATENCYFMWETREGELLVTDGIGSTSGGDPLILGENILTFQAEQSEDEAKSEVKVKGQRSKKGKWGEPAVLKTYKTVKNGMIKSFRPHIVQHNGDADDKTLERRARFEMNERNTSSKRVLIEVFHVMSRGAPWDVGNMHYVEVPVEGIFDMMECTELTYTVDAEKNLKVKLELSPPPSGGAEGAGGGFGLSSINFSMGVARLAQAGISMIAGQFPAPWSPPQLTVLPLMSAAESLAQLEQDEAGEVSPTPPPVLPPWFGETG